MLHHVSPRSQTRSTGFVLTDFFESALILSRRKEAVMREHHDTKRLEHMFEKFAAEQHWSRMREDRVSCVYRRTAVYESIVTTCDVSIIRNTRTILSCAPLYYFLDENTELKKLVELINFRLHDSECELQDDRGFVFHFEVHIAAEKGIGLEELFEAYQTACLDVTHKYFCVAMMVYWGKETAKQALEEADHQDI